MTLIIAYVDRKTGKSYMASDSLGSGGGVGQAFKNKKIFKKKDILFGGCGSYKQIQLLEKNYELPPRAEGQTTDHWIHNDLVGSLKYFLKEHDTLKTSEGILTNQDGEFLIIVEGRIFVWQDDLSLLEPAYNFATSGSGGGFAHAILCTLDQSNATWKAERKLELAVRLTSDYVLTVGGDFDLITA